MRWSVSDALDEISVDDIIDAFDIPSKQIRHKTYLICPNPAHEDQHFGSCVVFRDGFYCFACGRYFNKFEMIRMAGRFSKRETVDWIGNRTGFNNHEMSEEEYYAVSRLNCIRRFLNDIDGYVKDCPVYGAVGMRERKDDEVFTIDKNGTYIKTQLLSNNPLLELYKSDPDVFRDVVFNQLAERKAVFWNMINFMRQEQDDDYDELIMACCRHILKIGEFQKTLLDMIPDRKQAAS